MIQYMLPINSEPSLGYISFGPSGLNCSSGYPEQSSEIKSYYDYFSVKLKWAFPISKSSELFSCRRLWYLSSSFQVLSSSNSYDGAVKTDTQHYRLDIRKHSSDILIPLDACMEAPIANVGLFLLCAFLPQILYRLEMKFTAYAFLTHCKIIFPILGDFLHSVITSSIDDLVEALTAKSCALNTCYDRLEWLGDAVLKLIHSDSLFASSNLQSCFLHEGDLSTLRSFLGSNKRLKTACKRVGFDRFILFRKLSGGQWAPVGIKLQNLKMDLDSPQHHFEYSKPGNKVFADVIESLLGLIYIKFGFQAAYDVAIEICVTMPRDSKETSYSTTDNRKSAATDAISDILGGYQFQKPELLTEALSHPSCLHQFVPSYQRLEWIGDSVLSLVARDWIYRQYPNLSVSNLVTLESTIVCNESLARVCALNKLQVYMNHADATLPDKIEKFERVVRLERFGLWTTGKSKSFRKVFIYRFIYLYWFSIVSAKFQTHQKYSLTLLNQ